MIHNSIKKTKKKKQKKQTEYLPMFPKTEQRKLQFNTQEPWWCST
jgi:hypothetical protein